jgi:hypothetical protein
MLESMLQKGRRLELHGSISEVPGIQDSIGFVCRKEKGRSTSKCRTSNSPVAYVSDEDQNHLLDWTVDGLPPWM